ncbi:hypothetical protein PVAP13_7NG239117 [Panicum virgatum]|uniref:Uncharacterized protein n=1 Tax=Panicum virgatum TaxID=38727 RepID=A0A8T0Q2G7_PANVG|nr:hypothetical protein PVAP13_7NG239117 [Panicum virgatum]
MAAAFAPRRGERPWRWPAPRGTSSAAFLPAAACSSSSGSSIALYRPVRRQWIGGPLSAAHPDRNSQQTVRPRPAGWLDAGWRAGARPGERASSAPDGRRLAEPVRRGSSKQTRRCPVAGCLGFPFRRDGTGRMVPEAADPNQPPTTAKTDRCLAASAPHRQPRRRHDEPPRLPVGARTPHSINGAGRGDPPPPPPPPPLAAR